jgi:hypothetical protein
VSLNYIFKSEKFQARDFIEKHDSIVVLNSNRICYLASALHVPKRITNGVKSHEFVSAVFFAASQFHEKSGCFGVLAFGVKFPNGGCWSYMVGFAFGPVPVLFCCADCSAKGFCAVVEPCACGAGCGFGC